MGQLVVVTGPPGAGKSTVSAELADLFGHSALVRGDEFFGFLRRGAIDPWLPGSHEQNAVVVEAAAGATGRLARFCHVVYDGVIIPSFVPAFLESSGASALHYAVLLPPLSVCLRRIRSRGGQGLSDPDAGAHMWQEFAHAHIPERFVFTDTDAPPAQLARTIVGRAAAGTIRIQQ